MARNIPSYSVQVSFTDAFDTPDFVDITRFVKSGTTKRGRQHELQRAQAGTCALTITNQDGRFSTFNTKSPYVNILTAADSYFFDGSLGSWVAGTNSFGPDVFPGLGYDGLGASQLKALGAGTMNESTGTGANGYAVTAGQTYGFQCQFLTQLTARSCSVGAAWYNSSHTQIGSTTFGSTVTDNASTYTKATLTATTGGPHAVTVALVAQVASAITNELHFITRAMISHADQLGNVSTGWAPGGRGLVPARPVKVLATSLIDHVPRLLRLRRFVDTQLRRNTLRPSHQLHRWTQPVGAGLLGQLCVLRPGCERRCVELLVLR